MRPPAELLPASLNGPRHSRHSGLLQALAEQAPEALVLPTSPRGAAPARRASHATFKKLMVATMLLATVGTLASGTLATFTAQTANPNNTFSTGTLVLLDEINASTATDCYSTGGPPPISFTNGNVNSSCSANNFTPTSLKPGDPPVTMKAMVKNAGSIAANTLGLFTTACTAADNPSESFHYSGGDPCAQIQIYIQEWTSSTYATAASCAYGTTASATTCNFQSTSPTLSTFTGGHNSSANALLLSGGLSSGSARYFTIALQLPQTANNQVQGRQANFDFTWYLSQT